MSDLLHKLSAYPAIASVVNTILADWPEHRRYIESRFKNDTPEFLARNEEFAALALTGMQDDLPLFCADYRWMCEEFLKEEFHFRREGSYRLSTFEEAYREVYSNTKFMTRYVHGILISQIIWDPHARAFDVFRTKFLTGIEAGASYLEVGPGHGFYLAFAAQNENIARMEAWDVSPSSIAETTQALKRLGVTRDISIIEQDVLAAPARHDEFERAVISEVLEHLERPDLALQSLYAALRPGGRIFINVPINSPAPDHIYLWRSPEEFSAFVTAQGFAIEEAYAFPQTGASLERALKLDLMISCVLIARKPA